MTTPQQESERREHPLVTRLLKYVRDQDRGALAELRRGATEWPNCGERVLRHVANFFTSESSRTRDDAMLLVATLFALQPTKDDSGLTIAAALRATAGGDDDAKDRVERRFMRLLAATDDREAFGTELRHAVQFCAGKGLAPGWQRLLDDATTLLGDNDEKRERVRRRWAKDFWSPRLVNESEAPADAKTAKP